MKNLKALFGIAVFVSAFYMAFLLIPIYYNNYSFQDELDNQARMASYSQNTTAEQVQDVLMKKAKELEIPISPEDIKVSKSGADVEITTQYTVNVHTPVKDFELKFTPSSKNHRI